MIVGLSPQTGQYGIAPHRHLVECRAERVEEEQPPCERVATVEDQLQRLVRLQRADDAGQDAEDASLGAARRQLGRRRLGEEAAVAGPGPGGEHRDLPLEAEDRAVDDRDPVPDRGVVHEVASREVVRAVDDHVPAFAEDPITFSEVSRSSNGRTRTSGLSASIVRFAESTFGSPRRSVEWTI